MLLPCESWNQRLLIRASHRHEKGEGEDLAGVFADVDLIRGAQTGPDFQSRWKAVKMKWTSEKLDEATTHVREEPFFSMSFFDLKRRRAGGGRMARGNGGDEG